MNADPYPKERKTPTFWVATAGAVCFGIGATVAGFSIVATFFLVAGIILMTEPRR